MRIPFPTRVSLAAGAFSILRFALVVLLLGWLGLSTALAQTGRDGQGFDHLRTGFPLTGAHASQRCESCHAGGQFKGTPRTCNTCHLPGSRFSRNNVVMPASHYPTSQSCDTCHGTTRFAGARFNHAGVTRGACQTCHTGGMAVAKPAGHIPTQASCDSCHRTAAWSPASSFNHVDVVKGSCVTCHNGNGAVGKSARHVPVPVSQGCDDCHRNFIAFRPAVFVHDAAATSGQCASCHSGGFPPADGKSANHVPFQSVAVSAAANCDACHKGSFSSWANGRYHANFSVGTDCATCHTGGFQNAVGKPADTTHATVTGNCESCHKSTASWSGAKVDHAGFTATTNCSSCHAIDKKPNHMPTSANCIACHNVSPAKWTPTKWNHTQVTVAAQCASCHTGGYPPADGRSASHIPYASITAAAAANCDTCHKAGFSAWTPAKFHTSVSVSTQCDSCHNGRFPPVTAKPADTTHATVTGNCESCHKSTSIWTGARVDHASFNAATNCSTCHAADKTATHVPTSANCFTCHNVSPALWKPAKWNHTQVSVTAQCASCHTGGYPPADGKNASHVPYQSVAISAAANCDACHKGSFSTWANGRYHANFAVTTNCATCHTGAFQAARGKPADTTHATVTGNCESCHKSTAVWTGARVDHSTYTSATNCSSCHAADKRATHVPTSANCFICHSVSPARWLPTKWNHTQVSVTAQCASCHTGGYPPADGKSANHVPYQAVPVSAAANCDACHKGSFSTWANGRYHANFSISTGCVTCHTGAFQAAVGKPANATHATVTGNCEGCHKTTASWAASGSDHSSFTSATVCATCHGVSARGKSATHIPTTLNCFMCHGVAPAGWTPTKWNHTQSTVANQCASCHSGGYPPADGKPANHMPYANVAAAASANCDACHKGSVTTWANGRFHANFSISTGCKTCHSGAYLGTRGLSTNHIPLAQLLNGTAMECNACHTSTTSWLTQTMNHNNSQGNGSGWCKGCHLRGTTYAGGMERMSLTHERSTGVTDCSQSGCHRPLGNQGTAYRNWD